MATRYAIHDIVYESYTYDIHSYAAAATEIFAVEGDARHIDEDTATSYCLGERLIHIRHATPCFTRDIITHITHGAAVLHVI